SGKQSALQALSSAGVVTPYFWKHMTAVPHQGNAPAIVEKRLVRDSLRGFLERDRFGLVFLVFEHRADGWLHAGE
ncbi:MAG: hypothetical protein NZM42_10500, partial [Gemmatales bacterium]|nr:hypothetical protein [Gemmatales bacterium]